MHSATQGCTRQNTNPAVLALSKVDVMAKSGALGVCHPVLACFIAIDNQLIACGQLLSGLDFAAMPL